ncbi:MAG: C40 family peptidase [Bacteroidales bacterium]
MQKFGLCLLSQMPIRQSVSHTSEMVSQCLFGEVFCIEESYLHWYKIRTLEDGYEGWVDAKQVHLIKSDLYNAIKDENIKTYAAEHDMHINTEEGNCIRIGLGSRLPLFKEGKMHIDSHCFEVEGDIIQTKQNPQIENLITLSKQFLHTPYLWGGRSAYGIDCSGFSQMIYKLCGISLPRDAKNQAQAGNLVHFFDQAQANDLFFFDDPEGNIIHVGIYLGNNQIIHASGDVHINIIDNQGILNSEKNEYTHNLRFIKRFV